MISAISESMQQVMVYLMVLMQMVKGKGSLAPQGQATQEG